MRIPFIASGLLLALLIFLMNSTVQRQTGLSDIGLPAVQTYDYFMVGLDYTRYDTDSTPSYRLVADRLTHYPEPEYNEIDTPRFEIFQDEDLPWTITARRGRSEQDAEAGEQRVDLNEDVVIHGVDSQGRELDIYTDNLRVYPDSRKVMTDNEVLIEGEGSRITGTGMSADLNTRQITVLANVRGIYEEQPD